MTSCRRDRRSIESIEGFGATLVSVIGLRTFVVFR